MKEQSKPRSRNKRNLAEEFSDLQRLMNILMSHSFDVGDKGQGTGGGGGWWN